MPNFCKRARHVHFSSILNVEEESQRVLEKSASHFVATNLLRDVALLRSQNDQGRPTHGSHGCLLLSSQHVLAKGNAFGIKQKGAYLHKKPDQHSKNIPPPPWEIQPTFQGRSNKPLGLSPKFQTLPCRDQAQPNQPTSHKTWKCPASGCRRLGFTRSPRLQPREKSTVLNSGLGLEDY